MPHQRIQKYPRTHSNHDASNSSTFLVEFLKNISARNSPFSGEFHSHSEEYTAHQNSFVIIYSPTNLPTIYHLTKHHHHHHTSPIPTISLPHRPILTIHNTLPPKQPTLITPCTLGITFSPLSAESAAAFLPFIAQPSPTITLNL